LALAVVSLLGIQASAQKEKERERESEKERGERAGWVAGDFHQHTTYTDGLNSFQTVMYKNDQFGLDWWANSEHGGAFPTDARGPLTIAGPFNENGGYSWTDPTKYPSNPVLGDGAHVSMWRWQSLRDFSSDDVLDARATYRKPIFQSYEWNVPGHEHCSLGLIAGQFTRFPSAEAIAQFEYLFDGSDTDKTGGLAQGWTGKNGTNDHAKAVDALEWLQAHYKRSSYAVFAHPERKGPGNPTHVGSGSYGYSISDFRDFNNAAPDVAIGFESMPGHQKEVGRGGYGTGAVGGGTFGGVGAYAAKVGGLWDAMLGEGRHFWLFASSDFHNTAGDFWPGEYQKTYTYVSDKRDPQAIVNGLRSGNSFVVMGDLIEALDFRAQSGNENATMGETLSVERERERERERGRGKAVEITISFKSPHFNNNHDPLYAFSGVDHIDLIAGDVTGKVLPTDPGYKVDTNPSTRVIKTLNRHDFNIDRDGYYVAHVSVRADRDMYFRLRGTNLAPGTPNETDADGNPLADSLMGANTPAKAWADLWFYSNPIFVDVK
jgi:hypothetical protein